MEPLSKEQVAHVATLTHVSLTDDELNSMRSQLSAIINHFQSLQRVDTEGVPPTGHSTDAHSVMREDDPAGCLPRDQVLRNAPHVEDDYIRVLPILG